MSVTVQVLTALCPRLDGLHATPETSTGATRLIAAVFELVPKVAVTRSRSDCSRSWRLS